MHSHTSTCITHILYYRPIPVLMLMLGLFSCKPLIHSFSVTPLTITADDSVKIKWSVRGDATLLTHTDTAVYDNDDPQYETREYTLVVKRKRKEIKRSAMVNVLPQLSADDIAFPCIRNGDTLFAAGEKNISRWGSRFIIQSIASASGRDLTVSHMGRSVLISKDGKSSTALSGLPNSGAWEIKALRTPAEKTDTTLIPGTLRIHTVILYKK